MRIGELAGLVGIGVLTRTLYSDPGAVERAYADFAPAQAAAIRRADGLMREERRASRPAGSPAGDLFMKETTP